MTYVTYLLDSAGLEHLQDDFLLMEEDIFIKNSLWRQTLANGKTDLHL